MCVFKQTNAPQYIEEDVKQSNESGCIGLLIESVTTKQFYLITGSCSKNQHIYGDVAATCKLNQRWTTLTLVSMSLTGPSKSLQCSPNLQNHALDFLNNN